MQGMENGAMATQIELLTETPEAATYRVSVPLAFDELLADDGEPAGWAAGFWPIGGIPEDDDFGEMWVDWLVTVDDDGLAGVELTQARWRSRGRTWVPAESPDPDSVEQLGLLSADPAVDDHRARRSEHATSQQVAA